ncbi:MAG: phospholipid carrier-dependent glycosyltransferase, partial [Chloroflexota bacterium]|nr:phospholipid carrier-dependent glycosyltransferase [Chloroflexota bacterium]
MSEKPYNSNPGTRAGDRLRPDWRAYGAQLLLLALLLAYFAQGLAQVTAASITFDEGPHLAIGYATLRTGDFRLQPVHVHPPLANVLAAAPLLLQPDLPNPREIDGWELNSLSAITDAVVWQYPHPRRLAVAGRLPILLLSVLLGALVYRWSADLGARRAGLLALALCAFDPNLIAHGSLITTDMAAVCFSVAVLYTVSRRGSEKARERDRWLLAAGVLLGLAQLAKVSALMLVPVVGLLLSVESYRLQIESYKLQVASWKRWLAQFVRHALWVFLPAILVVWAGYGFEVGPVPGLPFPVPAATHLKIFLALREHYALGHPTFLLGRLNDHGWWWYFPVAFALKTPLPTLILALWAGLCMAFYITRNLPNVKRQMSKWLPVTLFPLLYAGSTLFSTVNIGYRHLLPILPFLYIGITSCKSQVKSYISQITHYGLLVWLLLGTLATSPYPLTFFNELAGGPENGYRSLVDSNLDWGQNLWDLKSWMDDNAYKHVYYAHYSPARPAAYGIHADFLPPDPRAVAFTSWCPEPGLYAISATVLQGPYAPDRNTYAWFRAQEPAARLGN